LLRATWLNFDRQMGQVDVHGDARHVAHEQVDRDAAFQRE
jgi:hypothetical protein